MFLGVNIADMNSCNANRYLHHNQDLYWHSDKEGIFRYYGTGRVAAAALAVAHASSNARTRERNGDLL